MKPWKGFWISVSPTQRRESVEDVRKSRKVGLSQRSYHLAESRVPGGCVSSSTRRRAHQTRLYRTPDNLDLGSPQGNRPCLPFVNQSRTQG